MRSIRRQDDSLPLPHTESLACDLDVRHAVSYNYEGVERRGVLAEPFAHIECEQCNRAALVLQQYATHDRAILVLQQLNELFDLCWFNYILILVTHIRFTQLHPSLIYGPAYLLSV